MAKNGRPCGLTMIKNKKPCGRKAKLGRQGAKLDLFAGLNTNSDSNSNTPFTKSKEVEKQSKPHFFLSNDPSSHTSFSPKGSSIVDTQVPKITISSNE